MKNPFLSKTIFIWQTKSIFGGDPDRIADAMQAAGIEAVLIKAADGPYIFKPNGSENLQPSLVKALHDRGIGVIGWGFLYGENPTGEAHVAIQQIGTLGLDGYVFDVEGKFDGRTNAVANATVIGTLVRASFPSIPLGYCGWALYKSPQTGGQWHPVNVAKAFMAFCDVGIPMIYWGGSTEANALWWLHNSLTQWKEITVKPVVPVGRAYNGDGGTATAAAMKAFAAEARALGCKGSNWWLADKAITRMDLWDVITALPKVNQPVASVPVEQWALAVDEWARKTGYDGPKPQVL